MWDAVGSEFASRHEHYERFYHGAPYVNLPAAFREGAPDVCEALADAALSGYALADLLDAEPDDAAPAPRRYIESGALTPSSSSARAIVRCAATDSAMRNDSTASGSAPTTRQSR